MNKKEKKYTKKEVDDFFTMLKSWLDGDMVQATIYFNYIEKRNPAYERGYRACLHSVLVKAEDKFNENYII